MYFLKLKSFIFKYYVYTTQYSLCNFIVAFKGTVEFSHLLIKRNVECGYKTSISEYKIITGFIANILIKTDSNKTQSLAQV